MFAYSKIQPRLLSASTTLATSETTNNTQDRSLTTSNGSNIGINDSPIQVAAGGTFNISSADADVANNALSAARSLASAAFNSASGLASGANSIAAQVADSQRAFVETASGQKTFLYGAGILALVVGLVMYFIHKKK
jgi:hypothetical protein